jgi:hypothetical protein
MKVYVGTTVFGIGYTVRLEVGGVVFRSGFQGTKFDAEELATKIRKSVNRSGTKKKSLTAVAGL